MKPYASQAEDGSQQGRLEGEQRGAGAPRPRRGGAVPSRASPLPDSSGPDDRCSPRRPTGDTECPPCHQKPAWLQGHPN